jgi:hypothetical protein
MRRPKLLRNTGNIIDLRIPPPIPEEMLNVDVVDPSGGMDTESDDRDVADNGFTLQKGFTYYKNNLIGNPTLWGTGAAPIDANKVLGVFGVTRFSGTLFLYRFTPSTVNLLTGVLTALVGTPQVGVALAGGVYDRFQLITSNDRVFFNNHGANVLMEINTGANTYAAAGNAREYRYYTVANRRIIGANLRGVGPNPIEIAGSGNLNFTEWNPLVDISAFQGSLVDSEKDTVDEITGLNAVGDNLIIMRSRSLWIGVPQPIASTPFQFIKRISELGCNVPFSFQKGDQDTFFWVDIFTENVWMYKFPDEKATMIGTKIKKGLIGSITDPRYVYSNYDPVRRIYEIGVENPVGTFNKIWQYHLDTGSWSYMEIANGSFLGSTSYGTLSGTWDGASGSWDSASGTWDGASVTIPRSVKFEGRTTGSIGYFDDDSGIGSFPMELESKAFDLRTHYIHFRELEIKLRHRTPYQSLQIYTSKDGGNWVLQKTYPAGTALPNTDQVIIFRKNIRAKKLKWRVYITGGSPFVQDIHTRFSRGGRI